MQWIQYICKNSMEAISESFAFSKVSVVSKNKLSCFELEK